MADVIVRNGVVIASPVGGGAVHQFEALPGDQTISAPDGVAFGDRYAGGVFTKPTPPAPAFSAEAVKEECARRILAVASDAAQANMTANAVAANLQGADVTAYRNLVTWIALMQAACRALIAAADATFMQDAHWPAPPADAIALASRF